MDNTEFPETFDLDRFVPDMEFNDIIDRFENGRTPKEIQPRKNKVLSVEEFKQETKPKQMSKEELKIHLEKLEEQLEKEYHN